MRRHSRGFVTVVVVALVGALGACGSSGGKAAPKNNDSSGSSTTVHGGGTGVLAGEWRGSWNRTTPDLAVGNLVFELTNRSGVLSGTVTAYGDTCLTGTRPISGSLKGSAVRIAVLSKGVAARFDGQFGGQQLRGSLSVVCAKLGGAGTFGVFQT